MMKIDVRSNSKAPRAETNSLPRGLSISIAKTSLLMSGCSFGAIGTKSNDGSRPRWRYPFRGFSMVSVKSGIRIVEIVMYLLRGLRVESSHGGAWHWELQTASRTKCNRVPNIMDLHDFPWPSVRSEMKWEGTKRSLKI